MSYGLNGKYPAVLGKGVLTEAKTGALMYYVEVLIENVPALRGSFCLVKSDGQLMQRNIEDLIRILAGRWDGTDIVALETVDPSGCEAVADCMDGAERDGKVYTEVRNVYPPNGGGGTLLPKNKVDAVNISSKYGAKFRAMFGARAKSVGTAKTVAKVAVAGPASAPRTPSPSASPATNADRTSSLEECWEMFERKNQEAGMKASEIADKWVTDVPAFGLNQATATPEQWYGFKMSFAGGDDEKQMPF